MKIQQIAQLCHESGRLFSKIIGAEAPPDWESLTPDEKAEIIALVDYRIENTNAPFSAQHAKWKDNKIAAGWKFGKIFNEDKKTHPCIIPYDELPINTRRADAIAVAIINAMTVKI